MRWITILLLVICIGFLGFAPRATGQPGAGDPGLPDTPTYSIDFPGGTLEEYCQAIRKLTGADIVSDQHAADVHMPQVKVTDCTVATLLSIAARQQEAIRVSRVESDMVFLNASPPPLGQRTWKGRADQSAEPVWVYIVTVNPSKAFFGTRTGLSDREIVPRFDLNFRGGRLDQYIEAIREAQPDASIVLLPSTHRIFIPPINLRSVTVEAALRALGTQHSTDQGQIREIEVQSSRVEGSEQRVYSVKVLRQPVEYQTAVWSIAELLELGMSRNDVASAIQTAQEIAFMSIGDDLQPMVRFHEETKLLIVRASVESLEVFEEILREMRRSALNSRSTHLRDDPQQVIEELRSRIEELELQLQERDQ